MSKFSLSTCQCFYRLILLIPIFLLVLSSQSFAEIYTYEQDGVIIISSEPPPRPKKRKKPYKRLKQRSLDTRQVLRDSIKRERQQVKSKVKRYRGPKKPKSLPIPRDVRRLKKELLQLKQRYKLPIYLLPALFKSCHFIHSYERYKKQRRSSYRQLTCLSPKVSRFIKLRIQNQVLKSKFEELEHSAWLVRKLINHFRGDLTLALLSYYMSAQNENEFRSLVSAKSMNKTKTLTLKALVNNRQKSFSEDDASQVFGKDKRLSKRAKMFLRYVLSEIKKAE